MLNPNMNYPYPLVRTHEEDYRSTIFKGELTVNLQPDCYLVRPAFEINNPGITELIEAGKLTYNGFYGHTQLEVKYGSKRFRESLEKFPKTEKSLENQWFSRLLWWR